LDDDFKMQPSQNIYKAAYRKKISASTDLWQLKEGRAKWDIY